MYLQHPKTKVIVSIPNEQKSTIAILETAGYTTAKKADFDAQEAARLGVETAPPQPVSNTDVPVQPGMADMQMPAPLHAPAPAQPEQVVNAPAAKTAKK